MPKLIRVKDYAHAHQLLSRCRKPDEGKGVSSWCRIRYTIGGIAFITDGATQMGILTPDNMFEFTMTSSRAYYASPILTKALHKVTPFDWNKEKYAHHTVLHRDSNQFSDVFNGLKVNYVTGEFINRQFTDVSKVNPDARRVWLRSLRKYKHGIKVRAKLGVLDTILQEIKEDRDHKMRFEWRQPDWFSDYWQDRLANAIRDEDFSLDILKGIAQTAEISYWNRDTSKEDVVNAFDKLVSRYSVQLRTRFGVFKEP